MDLLPEIETNTIMVMTAYPGASASDIEMNVSKPLENVLNSVSDLKHITSQSRENISIVTLEFNYGIDIDVATNDVRDKLDMVESSLPDDVENPIIFKFGTDDIPILILSVTAEESTNALYKILDDKVSNPLARISGVGAVSISGTPIRELQVYCDPYKLEAYGQTIEGISTIIAQENRNTPGGSVDIGSNTYSLRVQGEFTDAKQMLDLVIGSQNGKNVYLRDVARVEDSIDPEIFDVKSFVIMAVMMTGGIYIRESGLGPEIFIAVFYSGLGASLLLAGIHFWQKLFQRDQLTAKKQHRDAVKL